ncbi:hypothetical protein KCU93_g5799, partial [Aureobasidium melanogenum]
MSEPQDTNMSATGSESAAQSTTAARANEPTAQVGERATQSTTSHDAPTENDPVGNPNPLPIGYEIRGLAKPGQYDHVDMYPGIDLNENLENAFKAQYRDMLAMFEQGKSEAAEDLAHQLLLWGNLPVLYRVYAHIVLSYGPRDNLLHACKAVEEAEWGVKRYGDQAVGVALLDVANTALRDVRGAAAAEMNEDMNAAGEEDISARDKRPVVLGEVSDKATQENTDTDFWQTSEQILDLEDDDEDMLFDKYEARPFGEVDDPIADEPAIPDVDESAMYTSVQPGKRAMTVSTTSETSKHTKSTGLTATTSKGTEITEDSNYGEDQRRKKGERSDASQDDG